MSRLSNSDTSKPQLPTSDEFKDQLPKKRRVDALLLVAVLANIVTISALVVPYFGLSDDTIGLVHSYTLVVLVVILIAHTAFQAIKPSRRLSEYAIFSHYINHIVRDFLVDSSKTDTKLVMIDILDALSECLSIATGKKCSAVISEYDKDTQCINVTCNNRIYDVGNLLKGSIPATDFTSIGGLLSEKLPRYFFANDLPHNFKNREYIHPSLKNYKLSESIFNIKHLRYTTNWPLGYKSTIVLPIRYIPFGDSKEHPEYLAFLSVECVSKNVFDRRYHPEIVGATADALFLILNRVRELNKRADAAKI